jgi:hypothetical protein
MLSRFYSTAYSAGKQEDRKATALILSFPDFMLSRFYCILIPKKCGDSCFQSVQVGGHILVVAQHEKVEAPIPEFLIVQANEFIFHELASRHESGLVSVARPLGFKNQHFTDSCLGRAG